jgi:hypothetical protein
MSDGQVEALHLIPWWWKDGTVTRFRQPHDLKVSLRVGMAKLVFDFTPATI